MTNIEKMIKAVSDQNFIEFKKFYIPEMQKDYAEKSQIVRNYVLKQMSTGNPTHIG